MSLKKIQNKGGAKFGRPSQEGEDYVYSKIYWVYGCVCGTFLVFMIVLAFWTYPLIHKIAVDMHGSDIADLLGISNLGRGMETILLCIGFIGTGIAINEKWSKLPKK